MLSKILALITLQFLEKHIMIFTNHYNWLLHFTALPWLKVSTDCGDVWRQSCAVWQTFRLTSDRRADGIFFLRDKEKQTGWRHKWSKAVRKYSKSGWLVDDKSALKCASQAVVKASWRLPKPRPDNKCFNLRGESERQDMETWKQSNQDTKDGVRRFGDGVLAAIGRGVALGSPFFLSDPQIQ